MRIRVWCKKHNKVLEGRPSWYPMEGDGQFRGQFEFDTEDLYHSVDERTCEGYDSSGSWWVIQMMNENGTEVTGEVELPA